MYNLFRSFKNKNDEFEKEILQDNQHTNLFILINKSKQILDFIKIYLRKKPYMITPCDHIFHTICLEKWLEFKSECPYCKQNIPPIE